MRTKIKTIDVLALEWWDKVNGNHYFAGSVTVNFGLKDAQTLKMQFQYGYGDQYQTEAIATLEESKLITDRVKHSSGGGEPLWKYCERKGIILRTTKHENCKKSELKNF